MVHSIIIPSPLDAHISIKQSIYAENITINYMTILIKNYAARLDIVKISVFLVDNNFQIHCNIIRIYREQQSLSGRGIIRCVHTLCC